MLLLQTVWQHGFGYADLENRLLVGTGCIMRIGTAQIFSGVYFYYTSLPSRILDSFPIKDMRNFL